jgi:hypothetical protein
MIVIVNEISLKCNDNMLILLGSAGECVDSVDVLTCIYSLLLRYLISLPI